MYVYDKAKYHDDSVQELGLPENHATHHTLFFLRWLIEHELTSDEFRGYGGDILAKYRAGAVPLYDVYSWWDNCLVSDMLSDAGNAFAMAYFDFERGTYIADYAQTLQRELPSEFHVLLDEPNYQRMSAVIDQRYREWRDAQ